MNNEESISKMLTDMKLGLARLENKIDRLENKINNLDNIACITNKIDILKFDVDGLKHVVMAHSNEIKALQEK